MQIDFAFLCDAASESSGKVHAIGIGFERISVRSLPVVHPRAVAVVRFGFTRADEGEHPFTLSVLDADGRDVVPKVNGQVNLTVGEESSGGKANMIVDLVQLDLQSYGPHEVTVTFDGREFVSLPFEVVATG
ncbi:MAG: hypothetical protein WD800_06480 [Dehalococcoidia bacterium]